MTRLTVHARDSASLLVCSDTGRRWVLEAPPERCGDSAVVRALDELRSAAADVPAPPPGTDTWLPSLGQLLPAARGLHTSAVFRWRFAGRTYRLAVQPGTAEAVASDATSALLTTIAEARDARACAEVPLVDDDALRAVAPLDGEGVPGPVPPSDETRDSACRAAPTTAPAPPSVLERWADGAWESHPLDPPPLVDPVAGVLHRITQRPGDPAAPPGFQHLHAELPHLSSIDATFQPDPLAPAGAFAGSGLDGHAEAVLSGAAHLCGAYLGQGTLRTASAAELVAAGGRVLTVTEWRPHDPALHDEPGFPFIREHPQLRLPWLRGTDAEGACWVPLSLVHAGYLASGLAELPVTNTHNLAGLQAGFTMAEARNRAAAHLIAHDAVARWWASGELLREVPLPEAARNGWAPCRWRVRVLEVPSSCAVPVRLAVVDDAEDDVIALGFASASTPDEAGVRAVVEALIQHASARDLARPDSLIRRAEHLGNGGVAGLAPYSADRRYDLAFADRRSMVDPMCHVQFGLAPEVVAHTRRRVMPASSASASVGVDTEAVPANPAEPIAPYNALVQATSGRVVSVDTTTPRARAAGVVAVRLLAPTLRRLSVAAFEPAEVATHPYPGW